MDFFSAQDQARKSTSRLVILFGLAIISLIVMTNILVMGILAFYHSSINNGALTGEATVRAERGESGSDMLGNMYLDAFVAAFDWELFFVIGGAVTFIVLMGSVYKLIALSSGGKAVAEMLGGKRLNQNTDDPDERKILNVVEEMAIASGTPVPPVYLLTEEMGINAFAAGYSPRDAVIGVTRGCIKYLSRDQLQGVVAHEFSHILNGDMRLNIRLIGILHGILLLGMIGYYMLRSSSYSSRRNNAGAFMLLGLGLVIIGFAGSFFGGLIKAAVSRQREYLADASAVQYTRNPSGIADALKKIGGYKSHGELNNPAAPEMSHAFFANGISSFFIGLFATHPPLEDRIRAIDKSWDGKFISLMQVEEENLEPETKSAQQAQQQEQQKRQQVAQAIVGAAALDAVAAIETIGQPRAQHLGYAQQLVQHFPPGVHDAVHEPYTARAAMYCLVINKDEQTRNKQLAQLKQHGDQGIYDITLQLLPQMEQLSPEFRLPLVDTAIAALRELSADQYQRFKKNLSALIEADNKVSLFEWVLQKILFHQLDGEFIKHAVMTRAGKYASLKPVLPECMMVLSLLAHAEHKDAKEAAKAFAEGVKILNLASFKILDKSKLSLTALNDAIDKLALLKPLAKPRFLKACAATITADKKVSATEAELLRAFAATLDCPMPPLLTTG